MVSSPSPLTLGRKVTVREHGAHHAIDIDDRSLDENGFAPCYRGLGGSDEIIVQRLIESMILRFRAVHLGALINDRRFD